MVMRDGSRQIGLGGWVVIGGVVVVLVGVFGVVVWGGIEAIDLGSFEEGLGLIRGRGVGFLVRSVLIAGGIGLLAVVLGVPMGRALMGTDRKWLWGIALVPMWMPSYAIYGAMNLARAPDTVVGRWLISYATSDESHRWAAVWAGYGIGVLGLAVWGSVIGAVVMVGGSGSGRNRSSIYRDMMDIEPAVFWTRGRVWVGVHRGALLRAWGVVSLVMLGSGVPLHLAQIETWSIGIWRALSERGVDDWGVVWVMGSPMVLVGLVGAWCVTRMVLRDATGRGSVGMGVEQESERRVGLVGAGVVWSFAILVPMVVLGVSIDDLRAMGLFWTERGGAIGHSVLIGGVVGVIGAGFAMGVAFVLGHSVRWVRGVGALAVFASVAGALVPGVLVGASVVQVGGVVGGLGVFGEVIGLLARVLVVGGVVGSVVAGRESGELLSQRWSLGGGFGDWWKVHGRTGIMACVGAGVVCGLLAVHEIEASVMITRAGVSTLSQGLLADLHYARLERLSAALLNLMWVGLVVGLIGGLLMGLWGVGNRKDAGR